jgi:hypothetical protein
MADLGKLFSPSYLGTLCLIIDFFSLHLKQNSIPDPEDIDTEQEKVIINGVFFEIFEVKKWPIK